VDKHPSSHEKIHPNTQSCGLSGTSGPGSRSGKEQNQRAKEHPHVGFTTTTTTAASILRQKLHIMG
jgi:hypothetical protein